MLHMDKEDAMNVNCNLDEIAVQLKRIADVLEHIASCKYTYRPKP